MVSSAVTKRCVVRIWLTDDSVSGAIVTLLGGRTFDPTVIAHATAPRPPRGLGLGDVASIGGPASVVFARLDVARCHPGGGLELEAGDGGAELGAHAG